MHCRNIQLVNAVPNSWKSNFQQMNSNTDILTVKDPEKDQHIIIKSRIITVDKLILFLDRK